MQINPLAETIENVSDKFTLDSNADSASIEAYKIGKVVYCSGYFSPKAMTTLQNKDFLLLDSSISPRDKVVVITITIIKDYTLTSSDTYSHWVLVNKLGNLYTQNIGGWNPIGAVTTNTRIYFNGSWVTN